MSCLIPGLLLLFSGMFFFIEPVTHSVLSASDVRVLGFSLLSPEFRVFLAVGIAFCELVIIFSSASILATFATILNMAREGIRLIPLAAFALAVYKTFWPIVRNLLPSALGTRTFSQGESYIAQTVNTDAFSDDVLLTLATLLFFAITHQIFKPPPKPKERPTLFKLLGR